MPIPTKDKPQPSARKMIVFSTPDKGIGNQQQVDRGKKVVVTPIPTTATPEVATCSAPVLSNNGLQTVEASTGKMTAANLSKAIHDLQLHSRAQDRAQCEIGESSIHVT